MNGFLRPVFLLLLAAPAFSQAAPDVFRDVADQPGLPRVLIIGDSISMGYTVPVRSRLAGRANVHRIPENGGPTSNGIEKLDVWLGGAHWDVVHFNFGLHDLKIMDGGALQVAPDVYEANLRRIVARLKSTGARLVWATTTPVPEGKQDPPRRRSDVARYNAAARRVMEENAIPIDDLYALAEPRVAAIQRPANVHFTDAGYELLAGQVAEAISNELDAAPAAETPQSFAQAPLPRLERRGEVTHLMVDGKPWLCLAGELLNNAASTAENVRPAWPVLAGMHLNTVLVGVGWGWTEPEPGRYDFSALDGALRDARNNHLRVVLLWFGSWKNGTSSYPPAWVKRNWRKYPIVRGADGRGREILSPLSEANRDADARAYTALLRHVREVDSATRTVVMVQLENEVGLLGDSRDRSKEANDAFARPVPNELMEYLRQHRNALLPETRKLWDTAGGKTSGSWEEVFGKGTAAEEAFMAWHYARYMNHLAALGKKEYPLPVFVNAWLVQPQDKQPGDYPSGGPQAHNHDFWRAGAPAIDVLAPDIYLPDFARIATEYSRGGNPLFIPETRADAANAFYAVGQLNAQMFSPFGIERQPAADNSLAKAYDVLGQLAPMILEHQGTVTMKAVVVDPKGAAQKVQLGNYVFDCAVGRGWRAAQPAGRGYAILIQTGADEFWVAGAELNIRFASTVVDSPLASLAAVEEGRFENGAWVVKRHLAGDDTGMGGDDRASLRLTAEPGILHISLYSYR